jgi:CRP-like cAMP-binding protein
VLPGEVAILKHAPRTATCLAETDLVVLSMDRQAFNEVLAPLVQHTMELNGLVNREVIASIPVFKKLSEKLKHSIADKMEPALYSKGEYIVKQGSRGSSFFIVVHVSLYFLRDLE